MTRPPAAAGIDVGRSIPQVPDLARMRRERRERLAGALDRADAVGLLLLGAANVGYAAGAVGVGAEPARSAYERHVAVLVAGDPIPQLFVGAADGVPDDHPDDHRHGQALVDTGAGAQAFADQLADILGDARGGRLLVDELPMPLHGALQRRLPELTLADAAPVTSAARICKTPDELACIGTAQLINEQAMTEVRPLARPGTLPAELTGALLRRCYEAGAAAAVEPVWQVMPARVADGPPSVTREPVYPLPTGGDPLRHGDVVWVDSGVAWYGYCSDFGRTWVVGDEPGAAQRDQYRRWREVVDATLAAIRPGAAAGDLTRAARAAAGKTPWLSYFYLAHGVGLGSAEMPLVGTDLGTAFDDTLILATGMVLVIEPVVWDDGACGYRAEEIVAVTERGWTPLSERVAGCA